MSVFVRRFLSDPGPDILLDIESVNILDLEPPAQISGVGTGVALIVGEFENGPFNQAVQLFSATDLVQQFGSLGYTRNGNPANDCCAVSRSADGALTPEFWNGNALVQLNGKQFAALQVVRVNTSVGNVQFTPCAAVYGGSLTNYSLTAGQTLVIVLNGPSSETVTFTAVVGTYTGSGATYPVAFAGGETLTLSYDQGTPFSVTFQSTDTTLANVVDRINAFAGFTLASTSGGQLALTGRVQGTAGQVNVIAGSGTVLTTLGLVAGAHNGSGNVPNIANLSIADIKTAIQGAATGTLVDTTSTGQLRITNVGTPGSTGTIAIGSGSTAANLGFLVGASATAAPTSAGVIAAGTKISNTANTAVFVTMQDIAYTAGSYGPYSVPVRPAKDDGTGIAAVAGTITTLQTSPSDTTAFAVSNSTNISAALSETQIDAAYTTAIASTLSQNSVAQTANLMWSARQSNVVRQQLRINALAASQSGVYGRIAFIRTPMNTLEALALSTTSAPGVGVTRDQRVVYCYPQASSFVPLIATVGTAGGPGFTADGVVDIGWDGFMASICSQLAPEENPGQLTNYTTGASGIESGANAQNFTIDDYTAFKAAGICAIRIDNGVAIAQSGITSVDPLVNPNLVNIARRRMADYIEGSIAQRAKAYGKRLMTLSRRKALLGEVKQFVSGLLSANAPSGQRIGGYTLADKSNTPALLARGLYRIDLFVQTLSSMDSIVIAATIGETVQVTETLPQAA